MPGCIRYQPHKNETIIGILMMAINGDSIKALRRKRRESQTTFWRRFGVTQSRGSRFELGVELPSSVTILLELYLDGVIRDSDLLRARQRTKAY
jgi:hypothetical protein